jgi:hypothetical protein
LKKPLLCFLLIFNIQFLLCSIDCFAQNLEVKRTNHWYFGNGAGLDFSSGTAVADTSGKLTTLAGISSISDTAGSLLFYFGYFSESNDWCIYNHNHQPMQNGCGFYSNLNGSPRQSSVIVPKPGSNHIYYIFTQDSQEDNQGQNGLKYSEVDMSLNGGLGAVTNNKNILLFAPSDQQIAAVKHTNGCDIWVVSHERYSNKFRAYLVSTSGIDTNAVISAIGTDYGYAATFNPYCDGIELKFSPDGKKAAEHIWWTWTNTNIPDTIELYDFDAALGSLSNRIVLATDTIPASFTFSPDSKKFYQSCGWTKFTTYQYDLSVNSASAIIASKTLIYYTYTLLENEFEDFQMGRDGKIYGCRETVSDTLCVIHNPNAAGTACNIVAKEFYLKGGGAAQALPNFIQSYFDVSNSNVCLTGLNDITSTEDRITVYPNPFNNYTTIDLSGILHYTTQSFEITLYDATGRQLQQFNTNEKTITIKRNSLNAGIYLLKISTENKFFTQPLLITN